MAIDTSRPLSPGWWLNRLVCELSQRVTDLERLDCYYRGDPPVPTMPKNCRPVIQHLVRKCRANWANLIVEAVRERMRVVGFRTGAAGDELGDELAWQIWQANNLDADSGMVHRAKMAMRDAYVIVGDIDPETELPLITPEDPRQVITAHDPVNRRKVVAAVKVFCDDIADVDRAYVYLPGEVWRAERKRGSVPIYERGRRQGRERAARTLLLNGSDWDWVGEPDRLPTDRVPVVRFPNRADLYGRSLGEFEDVTDDIDRINIMLLQRTVIAIMQAFRQRAIIGQLPAEDENGNKIDYDSELSMDPAALWQLPADVTMWESAGVDLTPILESVKADVRDLAATTRTPMFYLFPDAANGSAEGATLQREGLVFKVADRIIEASDPWETVMSLAFEVLGDAERASQRDTEAIWQSPERFSLSATQDANLKAKAGDVPWRTRMLDILGYSPQQVDRMEAERVAEFATDPMALVMGELQRGRESDPALASTQQATSSQAVPSGVE